MRSFPVPPPLEADAYQLGHFRMIPPGMADFQCSQAVFRKPLHYAGDEAADHRIVSAGMMPFVALELSRPMTLADVEAAVWFLDDFRATPAGAAPYPFPRAMFERIVREYDGCWPICVTALRDGQAHYVGEPHVQVWTDEPGMGEAVGWIESTLLPYLWTSAAVATRGRIRKGRMLDVFRKVYPSQSADALLAMIAYKFHDFGRRGGAATQITGLAHLLNWLGTDTTDAAYVATKYLNDGRKLGISSIPAAAHRTVTPWPTEDAAIDRMIDEFGAGIFSFVADSYDYAAGIRKLAGRAAIVTQKGGVLVGRPDSGDPVQCVLDGLHVFADAFGYTRQESGLKVLQHAALIQGDGISDTVLFQKLYPAVLAAGFCPSNLAVGMGEYNHRAVRSDLEHAYKTCAVGLPADEAARSPLGYREVMKDSESLFKRSLPGPVSAHFTAGAFRRRIRPVTLDALKAGDTGELVVLYDGRRRPLPVTRETFDAARARAWTSWNELPPVVGDTIDPEIRARQEAYLRRMRPEQTSGGRTRGV